MSDKGEHSDKDVAQVANDLDALQEAGYDTSDAGRGNKAMSEKDVAELTDTSSGKAAEAAHEQRTDSGARK